MANDDYWVQASDWARKRFRCDYRASCQRPVRRIHVKEGEPQHGYCYPHYIEAKAMAAGATQEPSAVPGNASDDKGTPMKVELKTKRYFTCPNGCEHEMTVEHLLDEHNSCSTKGGPPRTAGPWYCDHCGQGWRITYTSDSVDVEPDDGDKRRNQWVILEIPPQDGPIRLKLEASRVRGPAIDEEADRYFYEEHTCPTNWFGQVREIAVGGETDPHGLARLVAVYDVDADADKALQSEGKEHG